VRYWVRSVLGAGLFLACVVVFNMKLVELLNTGTCASGNTPYVIAKECPEGTGTDVLLLVGSIFGLFISAGIFITRGDRPGHRPSGFAWPLLAWGIFFAGTGAVALIHSLTAAEIPPDAELGGIIVGATFLVMGVPALVFLATGVGSGHRTRETRRVAPSVSGMPADTIGKLERLQQLREQGALTQAEFEAQKARVLAGS
jgi:hypothetical protein